jgi:protein associated with RNAse G/E
MRLREDANVIVVDNKDVLATTHDNNRSLTYLLGLIIFLIYFWYNIVG